MDILKFLAELATNPIVKIVIGIFGLGSLFFIIDRSLLKVVKLIFSHEKIIIEAIDKIDENIDNLEKYFPETHKEIEERLLSLLDKIKEKIKD